MKLWDKGNATDGLVERFTIGNDAEFDMLLAPFDVLGSIAHVKMLATVGLMTEDETTVVVGELRRIYAEIEAGAIRIEPGVEDIHSQIELELTARLGDVGKKIHSGRSRNDQALTDIKLFLRHALNGIVLETAALAETLLELSRKYEPYLLPGYTHFQVAMPSSFGLWFGAYAESFADDLLALHGIFSVVNKNPLGSGAGYGSSFPLNRSMTTALLGFDALHVNSVYAQMTRGKTEKMVADGLGNIAATLAKLAADITLYVSQNFGFISFPDALTTGSSIMPHKKNPDVFELIRAKCNSIRSAGTNIAMLTGNLPSGYHRDMQVLKELLFPALGELSACLQMMNYAIVNVRINTGIMHDEKYRFAFSVEDVNRLVVQGVPFRDAYKIVAASIGDGTFTPDYNLRHTHEGSISNTGADSIARSLREAVATFPFAAIAAAMERLLRD